jgi:hypothetical protein
MATPLRSILAALVLITCAAAYVRADDKDDIKAAGKAFSEAMRNGDVATAKKHVLTNEKSAKFMEVVGDVTKAKKKLTDASVAKFGEDGKSIVNQNPGMVGNTPNDHAFDDADIEVTGDTAVATPKTGRSKPVNFRKAGGEWKLDFTSVASETQIERGLPIMQKMATAMNDTATEISDGKYESVESAKMGLRQKMMAALMPNGAPGAGSPPAGPPSNQ